MWLFFDWLSLNRNGVKVRPLCNIYQNVISLYDWKLILLCTCHILFIHSCIGGHLSYFSCLVIMNNTAMSICVWGLEYLFSVQFFGVWYIPGSRIARSDGNFMFNFWRNHLFSAVPKLFYIPTSSVWRFQFLCILVSTCYFKNYNHSSRCKVVSRDGFTLYFSSD